MPGIRINKLEGHYTIKRVKKLPKRGNSNWLYTLEKDNMAIFYIWTLENEYEKISISDSLSFATAIQQGNNITITGTGTATDPYIINAVAETATNTPVTPTGNLESDNVQDALEELQADIDLFSIQSDWSQIDNIQPDYIQNKPTNTSEFINDGEDGSSSYIQENNPRLGRTVSGIVDGSTFIATFVRDDSTFFSVDFSPIVSLSTGLNSVVGGEDITVDNTDPLNPIINVNVDNSFNSGTISPTDGTQTVTLDIGTGDGIFIYGNINLALIRLRYNNVSISGGAIVDSLVFNIGTLNNNFFSGSFYGILGEFSGFPGTSIDDLIIRISNTNVIISRKDGGTITIPDTASPGSILGNITAPIL